MRSPFGTFRNLPRSIWALFAVRLVISAGNFVFPFLTLILSTKLGWPADRIGLFLTMTQASALPGVFFGGKLSDRIGRKHIIIGCQGAAAILFIVSLFIGYKPILPFLVAAASVALSMAWPVSGALVADIASPEERKSAYALLYWGNNLGFSIGPIAAGFLFHRAPGLMFLGNACALMVSIFILLRFVPEQKHAREEKPASDQEAAHSGSLWTVITERPTIIVFALLVAMMNFVYSQSGFSLPLYLNERLGERGAEIFGTAMTVNGLTVVFCTLLISRISAKTAVLPLMAIAGILYALGFGLLALPPSFLMVMVSTVIWTWGEILSATNINVFIASKTPASHRGRMQSFVSIITNTGSLSAPVLAGAIINASGSGAVWPVVFFVALAAGVLMLGLGAWERAHGR
ncbi:MAG: MFS transporter [Spirochaetae bacterium HGW-Spirochaetae-9]|nr:MAG: MFS transporter [Spirochaetae bacterium HGW-Spirochaetae-9]